MEERVARMLEIAARILEEGRRPTEGERSVFRELHTQVEAQPREWKDRFGDLIDRLAAALEGMGV